MKKKKWIVHAILHCTICDWTCEDYLIADKEAKKHIRKTGHKISGELGFAVSWE